MTFKAITKDLSVSKQIHIDDIEEIKKAGFRTIICNRPDNEEENQPTFTEIASAAKAQGLSVYHLPVIGGKISDEEVKLFKDKLNTLPPPTLAYCRSGTRSITLWALSQAKTCDAEQILQQTKDAGYDLSNIFDFLSDRKTSH